MDYITINKLGRDWLWPAYDKKLIQVIDWVADCEAAVSMCKERRTVIQAGGATGFWPVYLSKMFENVVTFEPQANNYHCLTENTKGIENITSFNCALADKHSYISLKNDASESENAGTWFVFGSGDIEARTIDSLELESCDLICLDVEGHELQSLIGGVETITEYKPVIMLEEKALPYIGNKKGDAREWLERLGYTQSAAVNRDIVMCAA